MTFIVSDTEDMTFEELLTALSELIVAPLDPMPWKLGENGFDTMVHMTDKGHVGLGATIDLDNDKIYDEPFREFAQLIISQSPKAFGRLYMPIGTRLAETLQLGNACIRKIHLFEMQTGEIRTRCDVLIRT